MKLAAVAFLFLSACGGCGKSGLPAFDAAPSPRTSILPDAGASASRDLAMWDHARDGGTEEDLAALAVQEGAVGLVAAAADPSLTVTAIRAMMFARGWAQLPFLATLAAGKDDSLATLSIDIIQDLAARRRTSEDPEDDAELREGCATLTGLAQDKDRQKTCRIAVIRALRMMSCPPGVALPTDLDAK